MDLGDEILSRTRDAAERGALAPVTDAEVEALRVEALEQLSRVPEPPAYHRASDPGREKAQALLGPAEALLGRALKTARAAQGSKLEARAQAIASGLEAQLRALVAIAQGQILKGEEQVERARELSHAINELSAAFHRVNEPARPVFDRSSGSSRYDPQQPAHLEVTLPCPNPACRRPALYALSTRSATHRFQCTTCKQPFLGYFGEVRSVEQQNRGRSVHHTLRLDEIGGHERLVQFDDASGGHLPVAPHDLVALLYNAGQALVAVENLSTARVLWVQPRDACFLATAAYGPGAPELESFRGFRDRVLLPRTWGRLAVRVYYAAGPHLAKAVFDAPRARARLRAGLERLRPHLERPWT